MGPISKQRVLCWGAHSNLAERLSAASRAQSSASPCTSSHPGPPEEGPRVVFMVDLWHPNVAAAERQALDFIFAPGR